MSSNKSGGLLSFLPAPKATQNLKATKTETTSSSTPITVKSIISTATTAASTTSLIPTTIKTTTAPLIPRTLKPTTLRTLESVIKSIEPPTKKLCKEEKPNTNTEPINYLIGINNYSDSDSDDTEDVKELDDDIVKSNINHQVEETQKYIENEHDDDEDELKNANAQQDDINLEEIMKFHGGNKRKRNGPIDIVDVNINEVIKANKEDLLKNMTKEEIRPVRQFTPGGRKKHQITYLAMMAREREQELKSTWAENKFNKRMGRQKYGF